MFDHLVPEGAQRVKSKKPHKLIAMTTLLSLVLSFGIIWMMRMWFAPVQLTIASANDVTVQLIADPYEETIVTRPVSNWVLADLQINVSPEGITYLRDFSFVLTGKYTPTDITSVALYIDNAQVGYPVKPDTYGKVTFPIDSLEMQPGLHFVQVKFNIADSDQLSIFKITFSPDSIAFRSDSGTPEVNFKRPYSTGTIQVTSRGNVGAFVSPEIMKQKGVSLYAEGEDAVLDFIELSGDIQEPATISYNGEEFYISEVRDDGRVELPKRVYVLRRTQSVLHVTSQSPELRLSGLGVTGITSEESWLQEVDLPL